MSNMLAAHMDIENAAHRDLVQRFWQSPTMAQRPGLKAVDAFEAIYSGKIKAVWIMATNPVVSLPNADRAREALRRCELVIVSDCVAATDTTAFAHVLLPAAGWGEKDGTVTNSDRHISRQRPFLPSPGAARPDWWIICQIARRLGHRQGFEFAHPAEIFDEHARLSGESNHGSRAFDISGLAGLGDPGYAQLAPIAWPVTAQSPTGTARLFADRHFHHPDGRARFIATRPRFPRFTRDPEFPLILNTGRIRDQWHTMTRTGRSPRLSQHNVEPYIDMHAADARAFGLREGSLVRAVTRWGKMVGRLRTSGEVGRGSIFAPIHWSEVNAAHSRVGALISPSVDPVSGEPEFKYTPVRVEAVVVNWYGFVLSRGTVDVGKLTWWALAQCGDHRRYEMAGRSVPPDWSTWSRGLLGAAADAEWLEYQDIGSSTYRAARLSGRALESCIFVGPRPTLPSRSWLSSLFAKDALSAADRIVLLSGRPSNPGDDAGAPVCACFGVGSKTIETAILQGCTDTAAIGRRLKAGTNCGSCVPDLRKMLARLAPTPV
jgi:assimilatory nitrate reductase catalytic subunit